MVAVKIGDRSFEVAVPFKLRQIRQAAPHLDALNASAQTAETEGSMVALGESLHHMLAAILPGIQKIDPSVSLDQLEDEFDPSHWSDLRAVFNAIFNGSGMAEGEATAAAQPDGAAA
jgi:hypothetical protein